MYFGKSFSQVSHSNHMNYLSININIYVYYVCNDTTHTLREDMSTHHSQCCGSNSPIVM